jgi:hypothetical protein
MALNKLVNQDSRVGEKEISLLMPSDRKWSDKAALIQDYFRLLHNIEITIVDEPPTDGVLISLDKDKLITTAAHIHVGEHDLEALVLSDASLYTTMDDKAESAWRELPSDHPSFNEIPTMNMLEATPQSLLLFVAANPSLQHLMLKPSDEAASVGQEVVSVNDTECLLKYIGKPYVAQPFFVHHKILTIDFVAIGGDVKGQHCFYVDGPIQNSHWKEGLYQQVLCNAPPEILAEFDKIQALTHRLSKSLCLNGIFEIEYLYDGAQAFFLEMNLLPGLYGIDNNGLMPVLEKVVVPYLQHFDVKVQQRLNFQFGANGQFYPPSGSSAPYYQDKFNGADKFGEDYACSSTDCEEEADASVDVTDLDTIASTEPEEEAVNGVTDLDVLDGEI